MLELVIRGVILKIQFLKCLEKLIKGGGTEHNKSKKEKRKRSFSKDQISIMCAIDRNDNIIAEPISRGMASSEAIANIFKVRNG